MNLYGVVTGTDAYALNVSLPPGFQLCIGDTITINPINANTGAATLSVGGMSPLPLTLNGGALTAGQLEAGKDRQCTFKGSGFACDNAGGAGGASFVGTSSNLTLGDGSAGIVPAGNFGNLDAAEILAPLDGDFRQDTSDGSDNSLSTLSGGGAASTTRGAIIAAYGNEHANVGKLLNYCGAVSGAFWAVYDNSGVQKLKVDELGVRPQGTGGTGHILKQSALGGTITSGLLATSDIPKNLMMRASRITSDQGSLSGAYTQNTVLYNSLDLAEGSSWTLSSGVLTCALAGRWLIVANICLLGQTELLAAVLKGSTTIAQAYLAGTGVNANYQVLTVVADFAVSDTLKATAALNTSTSATLPRLASQATNGFANWIQAIYLGA